MTITRTNCPGPDPADRFDGNLIHAGVQQHSPAMGADCRTEHMCWSARDWDITQEYVAEEPITCLLHYSPARSLPGPANTRERRSSFASTSRTNKPISPSAGR